MSKTPLFFVIKVVGVAVFVNTLLVRAAAGVSSSVATDHIMASRIRLFDVEHKLLQPAAGNTIHLNNIKNAVITRPGGAPRVLIYITAACGACHLYDLETRWPSSMRAAPLLVHAEILTYAGCKKNHGASRWAHALALLPNKNVSLAWSNHNPSKQEGASLAIVTALENGWFAGYDWIIRVNLDVVVKESAFLESKLLQANTSAVLAICAYNQFNYVPTDFFASRPQEMAAVPWTTKGNAERAATAVFKPAIDEGRAVTFDKKNGQTCRVRNMGIFHEHQLTPLQCASSLNSSATAV